jgi:hypothetical protein
MDEDEFESGYTGTDTAAEKPPVDEPVVEEAQESEVKEEAKQEETPAEPAKDPLQEVLAKLDKFEGRIRNTEGHIGGLNHNLKQMQETLAASKAASQQVSDAPTQAQVKEAMSNPKEWDDLKADFPEWSAATEKFMDARLASVGKVNPDEIAKVANDLNGKVDTTRKESIDAVLDGVIEDWDQEVKKPEFVSWVQSQPENIQALGASENIRDAAKMLRMYATHRAKAVAPPVPTPSVATRQKRIEAAITPKGSGGFAPAKTDMDEFEAGYSSR